MHLRIPSFIYILVLSQQIVIKHGPISFALSVPLSSVITRERILTKYDRERFNSFIYLLLSIKVVVHKIDDFFYALW